MNWKRILKMIGERIIISIIFIVITGLVKNLSLFGGYCLDCPPLYGFPFYFYNPGGNYGPAGMNVKENFFILYFIFDLIFWYFVSSLIIWVYGKRKKK
jgi:hypothetical protein